MSYLQKILFYLVFSILLYILCTLTFVFPESRILGSLTSFLAICSYPIWELCHFFEILDFEPVDEGEYHYMVLIFSFLGLSFWVALLLIACQFVKNKIRQNKNMPVPPKTAKVKGNEADKE